MSPAQICDVLNRLLAIHTRSLPMYLASAAPWDSQSDNNAHDCLATIVANQRSTIDRLGELVIEHGGRAETAAFPMDFTSYHDLSMEFLARRMVDRQRQEIEQIQQILDQLGDEATLKPVVEETLGAAKGNLESMQELAASQSTP